MLRFLVVAFLFGVFAAELGGQDAAGNALPRVWLILPKDVPSENVQIDYFMTGPFGGYGGFVRPEKQRKGYEIEASVEGRPVDVLKVIAYLPGFEIVTLVIPTKGETSKHQVPCKKISSIQLRGQIFPVSLTREQPTQVDVEYVATWSNKFFGIYDGKVTTFQLGSAAPDQDGKFAIKLPAFYRQDVLKDGYFGFRLRAVTGRIIGSLKNEQEPNGLPLRASHEGELRFLAERW